MKIEKLIILSPTWNQDKATRNYQSGMLWVLSIRVEFRNDYFYDIASKIVLHMTLLVATACFTFLDHNKLLT